MYTISFIYINALQLTGASYERDFFYGTLM